MFSYVILFKFFICFFRLYKWKGVNGDIGVGKMKEYKLYDFLGLYEIELVWRIEGSG